MKSDRDWVIDRLILAAPSHAGDFRLRGNEHFTHVNRTDLSVWDFVGPVGFCGRRDHHGRSSGVFIIESWGDGTPT
jgi:hypothetical protein